MKKYFFILFLFAFTSVVSAHSTVTPSNTATSKYENFTVSVPTEKESPTTAIRLLIPESLDRVTPFVKPGWTIDVTKVGDRVTQIEWSGSAIPAGQKDIFEFTARTPGQSDTLIWKVYQTYQNGEVVAWDQDPNSQSEASNPYSTTNVNANFSSTTDVNSPPAASNKLLQIVPWVSLIVSALALWRASKNNS